MRYKKFRAPGRYHHGKITGQRMAIGVSEMRLVVYARSGRAKLIDSPFSNSRFDAVDVSVKDDDGVVFRVDYDRLGEPKASGEITIVARTPNAAGIVREINSRLGR